MKQQARQMVLDLRNRAHSWYHPHGGTAYSAYPRRCSSSNYAKQLQHFCAGVSGIEDPHALLQHAILAAPVPCHEHTQGDPPMLCRAVNHPRS